MSDLKKWTYKVKCRNCGKITQLFFGTSNTTNYNNFGQWAHEHSEFPISKICDCDKDSMSFHDLVSFSLNST